MLYGRKYGDLKSLRFAVFHVGVWVVGLGGVVLFAPRITLPYCGYCLKASMTGGIAAFRWGMGSWAG